MRRTSAILLIGVVMLVTVFGVFFMRHVEGQAHADSDCAVGAIEGASCESITNPLASIAFHMKALLQPAMTSAFIGILALAALVVVPLAFLPDVGVSYGPPLAIVLVLTVFTRSSAARKFRAWLTTIEKRDPSSMVAMST